MNSGEIYVFHKTICISSSLDLSADLDHMSYLFNSPSSEQAVASGGSLFFFEIYLFTFVRALSSNSLILSHRCTLLAGNKKKRV
jgi:hypothetical protein